MPKGEKSLGGFKVVLETSVPVCACVPACACLCLWPVAGFSMPDIISPKGARPASKSRLVFSMYIFRIPQSLPGYPASAADYSTRVVLRETESAPPLRLNPRSLAPVSSFALHRPALVSSFFDGPLLSLGLQGDRGSCSLV